MTEVSDKIFKVFNSLRESMELMFNPEVDFNRNSLSVVNDLNGSKFNESHFMVTALITSRWGFEVASCSTTDAGHLQKK